MSVTLAPLTDEFRPALHKVRVAADQVIFSGQPAEVLDTPDPVIDIHVVLNGEAVVGMFRIDRAYHTHHTFAGPDTPGLRTWLIDKDWQGRGIATSAAMALPAYLRQHYTDMRGVYLTVNLRNPAARRVYLRGSFQDTGEQWLHGDAGPQHILFLPLLN